MKTRHRLLTSLIVTTLGPAFFHPMPARAGSISTTSSVNLIDGPNGNSSSAPNSSLSSSASGSGAFAAHFVDTNVHLGDLASSNETGLIFGAGGAATYLSGFSLNRSVLGTTLPLNFNFTLTGSLSATSDSTNLLSLGLGSITYDVQTSSSRYHGTAQLLSQGGIPFNSTSGDFVGGAYLSGLSVDVSVSADLFGLTDAELDYLGIRPVISAGVSFEDGNVVFNKSAASQVSNAIFDLGLPSRNLLPGVDVSVGFGVTYSFDSAFSIPVSLATTDALVVTLASHAASGPGASARSDYANTLQLSSITVPEDFAGDISGLSVVFDSGLTMPVTRAESVPEPSSFCLLALGGPVIGLFCRRRLRRS